jgi:succinyl-CoA synthetase beta subunit
MKLLEYQSKEVFSWYKIPVEKGEVVKSVDRAKEALEGLSFPVVIKAQVPVGGRGKAGGIKLANDKEEALRHVEGILGMEIKGVPVKKVLISRAVDIKEEYYMGIVLDRRNQVPVAMISTEGGVDIEEVAKRKPEAIHKLEINPREGLHPFKARAFCFQVFTDPRLALKASQILLRLYKVFQGVEAQLAEINPLALDGEGNLWAVDAKIIVDDNALFRHPDLEKLRDLDYEDPKELEAKEADLSYVKLEGNIGCCVNGAGLAMATMDLIKRYGREPANFLDIGGSSSPEKVKKAMEIILSDPNVKVIYFNIFGGITRCDDVASGLIEAFREMKISVPVVIRLTGTNEDRAREMLKESGLPLIPVATMPEGAQRAVQEAMS